MLNFNIFKFNLKIAEFFYIIIFLGYILYSLLLYSFNFPAVFGGFFGIFTALCAATYFLTFLSSYKFLYLTSPNFTILLSLSFCWVLLVSFISYFYSDLRAAAYQSFEMIVFWFALFFLGFYFVLVEKKYSIITSNALLIIFLMFSLNYIFTEMKYMLPFGTNEVENDSVSGYQGIARNFLIISIFLISYCYKKIFNYLIIFLLGFLLFIIGSRSEFYSFLFCILCYEIVVSIKYQIRFIYIFIILAISLIIFFYFHDFISSSRQFNVVNISTDESWMLRGQMRDFALNQIANSPILGEFGGHVRFYAGNTTSTGSYSHNVLSAYVNYGFLFFIFYFFSCIYIFIKSALNVLNNFSNKDWKFCFLLSGVVLFLIIFTKPVFWPITYLSWGVFLGNLFKSRQNNLGIFR